MSAITIAYLVVLIAFLLRFIVFQPCGFKRASYRHAATPPKDKRAPLARARVVSQGESTESRRVAERDVGEEDVIRVIGADDRRAASQRLDRRACRGAGAIAGDADRRRARIAATA